MERKISGENGALAKVGINMDSPVSLQHKASNDRESQTRTMARILGGEVRLENAAQNGRGNSRPIVLDRDRRQGSVMRKILGANHPAICSRLQKRPGRRGGNDPAVQLDP